MLDLVDLEADLDSEERRIRDTAREFVDETVRPSIRGRFENGGFPDEPVTEMGELDCYALNLGWGSLPRTGAFQ